MTLKYLCLSKNQTFPPLEENVMSATLVLDIKCFTYYSALKVTSNHSFLLANDRCQMVTCVFLFNKPGPLLAEHLDVRCIPFKQRKALTFNLCGK